MKKRFKQIFALFLCAVMLLGSAPFGGFGVPDLLGTKASAAKVTSYSQGDIIEFGWYPQSKETDKSITDALTSSAGNTLEWNSYGYYSGTGEWDDGQMTPSNYMRYTDVMYGNTKYRGVVFDSYRPDCTGYQSTTSTSSQYQERNGYTCGNIYWFKYEPIKWRVLDPATGMVMAETILDSPVFNNYILSANSEYYGDSAKTYYANNYTESSIRKWLNDDFYKTAFSPDQQNIIQNTTLDNSAYSTSYSEYNSVSTNDKIYLLSYNDALNTSYGFSSSTSVSDTSRRAKGSDYAKCQGLYVYSGGSYDGNSYWHLRSPGLRSDRSCSVDYGGFVGYYYYTYETSYGVRPALNFNLSSDIFQSDVTETGTIVKTASAQTIDYRSIVTITATATAAGVPDDCKLAIYLGSQKVAEGDNKSVSYEYGEIKSDINYTVKVIDANGKVQKDSNGNELSKDGGKITCNAGFFKKLIAFFKGLFKSLPKVEVKP